MSSLSHVFILVFFCVQTSLVVSSDSQHILASDVGLAYDATLTFDDIACPTENVATVDEFCGISHYKHLDFSSFTAFNSVLAAEHQLVSPSDADCASSDPNALFGWRQNTPSLWPRFVLNATHAAKHGISPFFDLEGFTVKAMNNTPRYTVVAVNAVGVDFWSPGAPLLKKSYSIFKVSLRDGSWKQTPSNMTALFPGWGEGVNMVEMWAESPDGKDWPICLDDIRVRFHAEKREDGEGRQESYDEWKEDKEKKYLNWPDVDLTELGVRLSARGFQV